MGSRGFPYAGGGPHRRGFPYAALGDFLVDSQMSNACYTMRRAKINEINRKYLLQILGAGVCFQHDE